MTVLNVNERGGTWNVGVSLQALPPLLSPIPSSRAGYAGYDPMGESNQNLNTQGKLNMCSLESQNTSSTLDYNLSVTCLNSSLKTCIFSVTGVSEIKITKTSLLDLNPSIAS